MVCKFIDVGNETNSKCDGEQESGVVGKLVGEELLSGECLLLASSGSVIQNVLCLGGIVLENRHSKTFVIKSAPMDIDTLTLVVNIDVDDTGVEYNCRSGGVITV